MEPLDTPVTSGASITPHLALSENPAQHGNKEAIASRSAAQTPAASGVKSLPTEEENGKEPISTRHPRARTPNQAFPRAGACTNPAGGPARRYIHASPGCHEQPAACLARPSHPLPPFTLQNLSPPDPDTSQISRRPARSPSQKVETPRLADQPRHPLDVHTYRADNTREGILPLVYRPRTLTPPSTTTHS